MAGTPTTDLGVLVFADDAVGSLGRVDDTLPRQRAGVAELGIIMQQD